MLDNKLYFVYDTNHVKANAPLAQLVEQRTVNPSVASSILAGGAQRLGFTLSLFFYFQKIARIEAK